MFFISSEEALGGSREEDEDVDVEPQRGILLVVLSVLYFMLGKLCLFPVSWELFFFLGVESIAMTWDGISSFDKLIEFGKVFAEIILGVVACEIAPATWGFQVRCGHIFPPSTPYISA